MNEIELFYKEPAWGTVFEEDEEIEGNKNEE